MDSPLRKGKQCEDICVLYYVHQRVTSAKEDFNNQVDRMTCSVVSSRPLPRPPLPSPSGLMSKVAMVVGMAVMHRVSNTDYYSPGLTWLQPQPGAQPAHSTDQQ